jgi:hypothetical protein
VPPWRNCLLQVVLTNGTVVAATPTTHSDLLWALKVREE